MNRGYMTAQDEPRQAFIRTKSFYLKYAGRVILEKDCLVIQETDKAILIREEIQIKPQVFSKSTFWLPKSKLIEFFYY